MLGKQVPQAKNMESPRSAFGCFGLLFQAWWPLDKAWERDWGLEIGSLGVPDPISVPFVIHRA